MFDMTNDSNLFRTRQELEEQQGAYPIGGNRFRSATGDWLPLYEGKMVQAFDHRAASVVVNPENQHCPAQPEPTTLRNIEIPTGYRIRNFGYLPLNVAGFLILAGFLDLKKSLRLRTFEHSSRPYFQLSDLATKSLF